MKKAKVKTIIGLVCLIVIISFIFVGFVARQHIMGNYTVYAQGAYDTPFGEISAEYSLVIPLHVEDNVHINRISILLATYARENTCEVDFYLYKNRENVYSYTVENASVLSDNSNLVLEDINTTLTPEDEAYLLITSPDGNWGNAITVWMRTDGIASGTYVYDAVNNVALAVAQSAVLTIYGSKSFDKYIFAAVAATVFCAVIFLLKDSLWRFFSRSKLANRVVYFRDKNCSQAADVFSALFTTFFCCVILQSACFTQQLIMPLIPVAVCLLILSIEFFFKKLATRSLSIFSIVLTFAISTLLILGNADILGIGLLYGVRGFLYYVLVFVLCIAMPIFFARKFLLDCVRWFICLIKKYYWLAICLAAAAICGVLAEFSYANMIGQATVFRRGSFFTVLFFIAAVLGVRRTKILKSPEKLFLLIALSIGCYLSFALPVVPICWDEQIHYGSTIYLTQGYYFELTDAEIATIQITRIADYSETTLDEKAESLQELDNSTMAGYIGRGAFHPIRVGYLSAAMGIWLGKVLRFPFWIVYSLGRFGALLCYVMVIHYAIRRLINGKILLMIIGLIPTNLFLAVCYSYDAWVTSVIILSFAYFWGTLQRPQDKITFRECAIMLGALFLGILPKYIYFVLFFIFLLMPKEKFTSEKAWKCFLFVVAVCIILSVAYLASTYLAPSFAPGAASNAAGAITDSRGGSDVNGKMQIMYILTHPFTYAKTLLSFLQEYLSLENSADYLSFFAYMGGTGIHTLPMVLMFVAALTDCVKAETLGQRTHIRAFCALILFATAAAVATVLYIAFTPVGHYTVNGCQPRYLLPLLFPFFALVFHHKTQFTVSRTLYNGIFSLLGLYFAASTVWSIYLTKLTP